MADQSRQLALRSLLYSYNMPLMEVCVYFADQSHCRLDAGRWIHGVG